MALKAGIVTSLVRPEEAFSCRKAAILFSATEKFALAAHITYVREQQIEILVAPDRVQMFGVHDQQRRGFVMIEETAVTFTQAVQIGFRYAGLHRHAALFYPFDQSLRLRLQVNDKIGPRHLRAEMFIQLTIQVEFVVAQGQTRENRIFIEQEIR